MKTTLNHRVREAIKLLVKKRGLQNIKDHKQIDNKKTELDYQVKLVLLRLLEERGVQNIKNQSNILEIDK